MWIPVISCKTQNNMGKYTQAPNSLSSTQWWLSSSVHQEARGRSLLQWIQDGLQTYAPGHEGESNNIIDW